MAHFIQLKSIEIAPDGIVCHLSTTNDAYVNERIHFSQKFDHKTMTAAQMHTELHRLVALYWELRDLLKT